MFKRTTDKASDGCSVPSSIHSRCKWSTGDSKWCRCGFHMFESMRVAELRRLQKCTSCQYSPHCTPHWMVAIIPYLQMFQHQPLHSVCHGFMTSMITAIVISIQFVAKRGVRGELWYLSYYPIPRVSYGNRYNLRQYPHRVFSNACCGTRMRPISLRKYPFLCGICSSCQAPGPTNIHKFCHNPHFDRLVHVVGL